LSGQDPVSESPFSARCRDMGPDDGRVDHLHAVRFRTALRQSLEHRLPYPRKRPAPELPVDRRPLAKMLGQVPPLRPVRAIQNTPSSVSLWSFGGRPDFPPLETRKGSKNAHSPSDINPRTTTASVKTIVNHGSARSRTYFVNRTYNKRSSMSTSESYMIIFRDSSSSLPDSRPTKGIIRVRMHISYNCFASGE
jgi:hypothetical protein